MDQPQRPVPGLAICISGNFAAISCFEDEDGNMWLSLNELNDTPVTFTAGGEEWAPEANAVVSVEDALACAEESLMTAVRPESINWQEL